MRFFEELGKQEVVETTEQEEVDKAKVCVSTDWHLVGVDVELLEGA